MSVREIKLNLKTEVSDADRLMSYSDLDGLVKEVALKSEKNLNQILPYTPGAAELSPLLTLRTEGSKQIQT